MSKQTGWRTKHMTDHTIPQYPESYWLKSNDTLSEFPPLEEDIKADITIVGAGLW